MRVGFFVTCLVDLMRPRIGFAALKLLEDAGCEVVVPATQTCCGQPGFNAGDRPAARALALKLVAEFEDCDYVVAPSGSCAGMVRVHYPELFANDAAQRERVGKLAAKTHELTDFLTTVLRIEGVLASAPVHATYHDCCSGLRELGVKAQPRKLLRSVSGLRLTEMEGSEECCGFGGAFAVKYGELSAAIGQRKCEAIHATGADAVVMGDLGCMLHVEGCLRRQGDEKTQVLHVAEVLARGWE